MDIGVKINDKAAKALLKEGGTKAATVLAQALTGEAQLMIRDAVRLAPWQTRTLRKSATVLPPSVIGAHVSIRMGFGGAASKYAEIQHDKFPHKRKPGTQWHYLVDAVKARAKSAGPRISKRMEALLKGGA